MAGGKAEEVFGCVALLKQISTELPDGDIFSVNGLRL